MQTERLASMGQISAGVAHEINNPLSTILLYSHMLLKAHREGDPESEDIQMIVSEANRCRSIMRGLLDFARQSRVVKTPTDLGTARPRPGGHDEHEAGRQPRSGARRGRRGTAASASGRRADQADARESRAERDRRGGVSGIGATTSVIDASVRSPSAPGSPSRGTSLVLRVKDTGGGMPPEVLKEIFTPFYTTKQLGKGTGMGLSIVYGVVKMHAGDITVDSEVGKGNSISRTHPHRRDSQGRKPMSAEKTVLLVDDDADFVEMNRCSWRRTATSCASPSAAGSAWRKSPRAGPI